MHATLFYRNTVTHVVLSLTTEAVVGVTDVICLTPAPNSDTVHSATVTTTLSLKPRVPVITDIRNQIHLVVNILPVLDLGQIVTKGGYMHFYWTENTGQSCR